MMMEVGVLELLQLPGEIPAASLAACYATLSVCPLVSLSGCLITSGGRA
jgi:hypothetical protein